MAQKRNVFTFYLLTNARFHYPYSTFRRRGIRFTVSPQLINISFTKDSLRSQHSPDFLIPLHSRHLLSTRMNMVGI